MVESCQSISWRLLIMMQNEDRKEESWKNFTEHLLHL